MSDIKKHMPIHKFYLWYHSQDWINEGPTVEGLNREDRKWPRPEPKYVLPPLEPKRVCKTTQPTPKAEAKRPRKKHGGFIPLSGEVKVCRRCEQLLPVEYFREIGVRKDGGVRRETACRACERAYQAAYRARKRRGVYLAPKLATLDVIPSPM